MDSQNLHLYIDFVGSSGVILSPEQKAALQTSLVVLKTNHKFAQVKLWGKINGVKEDYYIAQGYSDDQFADKTTLYSKDCINWGLLTPATEETLQKARIMNGRFTGDPSHECEHHEVVKTMHGDNESEEEIVTTLKEEDRLAAVIADIDHDVKIAPRGAYAQSSNGQIYENRSFDGLSVSEAAKLCNYSHMRSAEVCFRKAALQRANFDKSLDFMDCLEEDMPKGAWSLQMERGGGQVTLRSLLWLGHTFFHVPDSRIYGSIYVGNGERNIDLPFML